MGAIDRSQLEGDGEGTLADRVPETPNRPKKAESAENLKIDFT